jgi:hypothetical protein
MRRVSWFVLSGLMTLLFLTGCGGTGNMMTPPPSAQSAQVTVSVKDTPPSGVTVFSFEVSVTGATLNPGDVDLLGGKGPIRIEVKKLETDTAFLSTGSIAAGNYTSLNLTFANPELTFRNDSGSTVAGCASGRVCEINPSGPLSSTVNGAFTVMSGSPSGLLIDLNLSALLTQSLGVDFSSASSVSVSQKSMQPEGELEDVDHVDGIVSNVGPNQVTIQTTELGNVTVAADNNTQFDGFDLCSAANFSCLMTGQSVEVDLMLLGGGTFLAKKIELQDDVAEATSEELEGVVSQIDSATQFEMVVIDELTNVANVSVGNPIIVTLQSSSGGTSFQVDANGLSIPSALQQSFEAQTDTSQLLSGQTVQIRKISMTGGPAPAPIMVTTDRVRLRVTRFTATVSGAPGGSSFNVGSLPGIFGANGIAQIQVQTSSQTNFDGVNGTSGLADAMVVSLRGLLFKSSPNPILIADKVRKR